MGPVDAGTSAGCPGGPAVEGYAFSMLKVGFRGDMKFVGWPNVIEVAPLLQAGPAQEDPEQDFGPTLKG